MFVVVSSSAKISNLIFSFGSSSSYYLFLTTVCFLATPGINGFPLANKLAKEFLKSESPLEDDWLEGWGAEIRAWVTDFLKGSGAMFLMTGGALISSFYGYVTGT